MVSAPWHTSALQALTAWPPALTGGATSSAKVPERAWAPDKHFQAVGTVGGLSYGDSAPPRVVGLSPFPAVAVLHAM